MDKGNNNCSNNLLVGGDGDGDVGTVLFSPFVLFPLGALTVLGAVACAACARHFCANLREAGGVCAGCCVDNPAAASASSSKKQRRSINLLLMMDSLQSLVGCLWLAPFLFYVV